MYRIRFTTRLTADCIQIFFAFKLYASTIFRYAGFVDAYVISWLFERFPKPYFVIHSNPTYFYRYSALYKYSHPTNFSTFCNVVKS